MGGLARAALRDDGDQDPFQVAGFRGEDEDRVVSLHGPTVPTWPSPRRPG